MSEELIRFRDVVSIVCFFILMFLVVLIADSISKVQQDVNALRCIQAEYKYVENKCVDSNGNIVNFVNKE